MFDSFSFEKTNEVLGWQKFARIFFLSELNPNPKSVMGISCLRISAFITAFKPSAEKSVMVGKAKNSLTGHLLTSKNIGPQKH